ncbi:MAG: tRNA-binding protein [Chitinophagales bacterium]|nr:tRNA-binding protein [Chitinophagales bacterium]
MPTSAPISWQDFQKVKMVVGTIIQAEVFTKARKPAYKLTIDFGHIGIRKSAAQITKRYAIEDLIGLQIVAVINFPPKQISDLMSECLVLGAVEDDNLVTLLSVTHGVQNGTIIG